MNKLPQPQEKLGRNTKANLVLMTALSYGPKPSKCDETPSTRTSVMQDMCGEHRTAYSTAVLMWHHLITARIGEQSKINLTQKGVVECNIEKLRPSDGYIHVTHTSTSMCTFGVADATPTWLFFQYA